MKRKFTTITIALLFSLNAFSQWQTYPYSPPGSVLTFPIDDGRHTDSRTSTEWWYLNLHLIGSAPAFKKYDVMLCYFIKPATMRIFNITDPVSGVFHTNVNQTQFVLSAQTGHWQLSYHIPLLITDSSKWMYPENNKTYCYFFHAEEPIRNDELEITVTSNRPPLVVGGNGFIAIGDQGDSSFYYSYTNMKVEGTIKFNGVTDTISSGIGWIDRQWGPFTVGINTANRYEWYSLQLDKSGTVLGNPQSSSEFNIWQIYNDSNSVPYNPASRLVSALYSNETQDTSSTFIFERTGYWHDAANNKYYSQGWRFINPARGVNLDMTPTIDNQVIDVTLFRFWEGGTVLKGTVENQPVEGVGFAELVQSHNGNIFPPSAPTGLQVTRYSDHDSICWSASTAGTYPIGGYRIFRSSSNDGYWNYVATTTELFFNDFSASKDSAYYYTITSFDNQTATSASKYANAAWVATLGVNEVSQSGEVIKVYPNPASNVMTVKVKNSLSSSTYIITDETGRIVQSGKLSGENTEIAIKKLMAGVYLLQIGEYARQSFKVIKK